MTIPDVHQKHAMVFPDRHAGGFAVELLRRRYVAHKKPLIGLVLANMETSDGRPLDRRGDDIAAEAKRNSRTRDIHISEQEV